ncbi:MAG: type 1 periplasmic binding fold superfamily protein [Flavobacteriaceae bacterium]|nr:type 1 periplasmic binding fold superfamily protein [Flavobacteriaceae bacterium]|tara:strand:- start:21665 stop:22222 length:558 start_codon:yes stop_codon:yes gene_type:complete
MKKFLKSTIVLSLLITAFACSNDDDTPEVVNEEEVITTITLTLTPQGGGTPIVLQSRDLDGDGPNDPVITVGGALTANTTYNGAIVFLNETESPAENITEEVIDEAEEHQVFYVPSSGLNATFTYEDFDGNGNPLGTLFTLEAGAASSGNLNVVLRHEPQKPNNGTLGDAGGETDVSVTFNVNIQ